MYKKAVVSNQSLFLFFKNKYDADVIKVVGLTQQLVEINYSHYTAQQSNSFIKTKASEPT